MFLTVTNLLAIEPGYKFCFSQQKTYLLLRGWHYFFLYHFFILILLPLFKQLHQCNPRGFQRREKGLAATREAGKAMLPGEYRSQHPYSVAEGACSHPSSSPSLFSWQPDLAQTQSLQHPGDVLLGQNGLILGQRGNLLVERYLRKLVPDWDGLLTRSQGEVGHTSMEPFQGHWCWMQHGEKHWWGWSGWESSLLSSV